MDWYVFFSQLLIITFVSNVHESAAHDEVDGGIFFFCIISYILDKRIFLHILIIGN